MAVVESQCILHKLRHWQKLKLSLSTKPNVYMFKCPYETYSVWDRLSVAIPSVPAPL